MAACKSFYQRYSIQTELFKQKLNINLFFEFKCCNNRKMIGESYGTVYFIA
ncbi:hypothetical protein SAMN05444408_10894 [Chryseobacterium takakiae]|jgi:hypothetical protein|uniref:Uncharacterized protein n=1 Tax=Chryseobacterium takakiae TaxID=1302685 RepID=A0A1M4YLB8_9FLAO|nr:hypothetical protein SAMN05444408_10894 [Chryseobacterium takakiae]